MGGADGPGGGAAAGGNPAHCRAGGLAVRPGGSAGAAAPGVGAGQAGAAPRRTGGRHPLGAGAGSGAAGALLYFIWGELLLALRLRLCAQRLIASGERDGSLWFFLPAAALLVLWMARGKLSAFAPGGTGIPGGSPHRRRGGAASLSLPQVRGEHLLPLWWGDALPVLRSAVPLLGGTGLRGLCRLPAGGYGALPPAGAGLGTVGRGGCLLLGAEQAVVIGNLGPELAQRLNSPFFALAKSVGVEGAFQRVESIIAALWTFGDLALLGGLAFALWKAAKQIFPRAKQKPTVTAILIPGAVLGIAAFPEGVMADVFSRETALPGQPDYGAGAAAFGAGRVLGAGDVPSLPTFCV